MLITHRPILLSLVCTLSLAWAAVFGQEGRLPNVVFIMTDNHGAWTLGCYGNPDIRTPNIDRLAQEGTLFTRAFASNPVCSPTRATFLTGLLPSQHGVHCFLRAGRLQVGPGAANTLAEFRSLPEVLHDNGYACGLVGKWHLGGNLQSQEGFDDYWITMPHGGTSTFYNAQVIEDGKIRQEPEYLTDFWTRHAVQFIEQCQDDERPFFLFLAYNGPYSLSRLLLRQGRNRHADYYADKQLPSFPREPTHPWQYSNRDYINNPVSIRRVATEVSGIDDGVGTVLAALRQHGLDDETLVVFTADQGWVGGHGGFWGMGDHTRPLTAFDGMMRIPMIWRHPGKVAAAQESDAMVSNYDFKTTMLSYLGLNESSDTTAAKSPGRDFSNELTDATRRDWNDQIFYEFENLRAIRTDRWKYVHRYPNGPHELYDLVHDPEEQANLVGQNRHGATRRELYDQLESFYEQHADPRYDLWKGGGAQTALFQGVDKAEIEADAAQPPPLTAGFELAEIAVPAGYSVELVAGPPLVEHPLMANFDDHGRLYIAEAAGLNLATDELEKQLPNFIRRLEDTDGDGRFDRSTVFADKMTFPQGALWHDGALYVASPPNIWRLEDTDDDGVADRREVLVDRFGYTGNAASVHGCFLGPDGRIYWCDGRHGHQFRDASGAVTSQGEGAYIFSCKPDGSDPRAHCGGGMDNPVEVDFTEEGEVLGTVNILYRQPREDCLVHWLHGGVYPHSERVLGEFQRTGDLLGPVHRFGHVAVSGMTRYRSGVMDRRFRDDIFVTIFNTGKVLRVQLDREGASFRAVQHEFLASSSADFHPTDVLEDADGSLLVIDTGGWFRKGCPTSQIAKPEIKGGIYRVRRTGMTPLLDPWGKGIDWLGMTDNQAVALLNDTRFKVRERAIHQCAQRGEAMTELLKSTIARRDSRQRRNAVWALTRIGSKQAQAAVRQTLQDSSASVRHAACRSVATTGDAQSVDQLLKILAADEPPLRREAATALGRIGDAQAVTGLLKALARPIDRTEEHSIIYALLEINDPHATVPGLAAANANVQRATLIALDQMHAGELAAEQVAPLLFSEDQALAAAAVSVFQRRPDWSGAALVVLKGALAKHQYTRQQAEVLRDLAAAHLNDPNVGELIGSVLQESESDSDAFQLALGAITTRDSVPLHDSWIPALTNLLDGDDRQAEQAIDAIAAMTTSRFDARLKRVAADEQRPTLLRVAALEAVSNQNDRIGESAFRLLQQLLGPDAAQVERLRAAQRIASARLTHDQLLAMAPLLAAAGPLEIRELIKPYNGNTDPEIGKALLAATERAPGFWNLSPSDLWYTVHRCPAEVSELAKPLVDKLQNQENEKQQRLADLNSLLEQGDSHRGRQLFHSETAKCSVCHHVAQQGGEIGPDLTRIGRIRSGRDLLEAIVFPSSSFVREYQPYNILTLDGKIHSGIISRNAPDLIVLQTALGQPVTIRREDIEEIVPSTVSIMPQGLDKTLTRQQVSDLVAYLMSLK